MNIASYSPLLGVLVSISSVRVPFFADLFSFFVCFVLGSLQIIEKGYAYPLDGDVYFAADKFPKYGQLSRRKLEDNRAGERVAVDSRKRHPADFALWKVQKTLDILVAVYILWLCYHLP